MKVAPTGTIAVFFLRSAGCFVGKLKWGRMLVLSLKLGLSLARERIVGNRMGSPVW